MTYQSPLYTFGSTTSVWSPPTDGAFTLANRYPFPFPTSTRRY